MYELGNTTTYRIILALSVALFLHTLIALALARYHWSVPTPQQTVEFELVRSGSPTPPPTAAALASTATPESRATPEKKPEPSHRLSAAPQITTTADSRPIPEAKKEAPRQQPKPQKAAPAASKATTNTAPSPSSTASKSTFSKDSPGQRTLNAAQHRNNGIAQLTTHEGKPLSAYEKVLWAHIAERIRFAPFMQNLDQVRTVRLELTLMSNGTLEKVRVIDSSNNPAVDQAAKHATIMASPYPPPPETERNNGYRFQVELAFTPASS